MDQDSISGVANALSADTLENYHTPPCIDCAAAQRACANSERLTAMRDGVRSRLRGAGFFPHFVYHLYLWELPWTAEGVLPGQPRGLRRMSRHCGRGLPGGYIMRFSRTQSSFCIVACAALALVLSALPGCGAKGRSEKRCLPIPSPRSVAALPRRPWMRGP